MTEKPGFIPVARPWIDGREAAAARRVLMSGWVTQGPEVAAFEREFAAAVGAPHACAASSCTTALHLALLAVGVRPGDEVVTVSHSFIATANSILYCGATPVFVDIEPATYNLDPALLERAICSRTRAILCVHQVGMPANLEAVGEIARRHSIPLVEDAACAIGSEISWNGKWEMIGKPHGDIACFSFHPRKLLTTGDGGMVTTANPEFDRKCRLLRQHAMSASASERHQSGKVTFEEYPEIGYNYRMTDIQAAIGREQLRRLPKMITRRRELAARYNRILSEVTGVTLPFEPPFARSNWQSYLVRLPETVGQKETMQFMLDRGVATRRGVMCCHREPAYRDNRNFRVSGSLGESESAQEHAIILPLFHQMTEAEQDRVAEVLSESLAAMSPAKSARRS